MTPAKAIKTTRLIHNYVGVFFTPAILFFATTGGLQMFGLHQAASSGFYTPPALLAHLAQLHKKGTLYLPSRKPAVSKNPQPDSLKPDKGKVEGQQPSAASSPSAAKTLPVRVFFAATALALILSSSTGLFLSFKYARRKVVVLLVLLGGLICPLLLLLL